MQRARPLQAISGQRHELSGCVTQAAHWRVTLLININYNNQHAEGGIAVSLTGMALGGGCGEAKDSAATASGDSSTCVFKERVGGELCCGVVDVHQRVGQEHSTSPRQTDVVLTRLCTV